MQRAPGDLERLRGAALDRVQDLELLAVAQLDLRPLPARDHLAVDRDRRTAAVHAQLGHHGLHRRAVGQLAVLAVHEHLPHARTSVRAKRSGASGASSSGSPPPASRSATASPVSGASSTPLRQWPVAQTRPSSSPGPDDRGVVGSARPQPRARLHQLELGDLREDLPGGLQQAVDAVGGDGRVEALLLHRRAQHHAPVAARHEVAARRAHDPLDRLGHAAAHAQLEDLPLDRAHRRALSVRRQRGAPRAGGDDHGVALDRPAPRWPRRSRDRGRARSAPPRRRARARRRPPPARAWSRAGRPGRRRGARMPPAMRGDRPGSSRRQRPGGSHSASRPSDTLELVQAVQRLGVVAVGRDDQRAACRGSRSAARCAPPAPRRTPASARARRG